ncbi:zinc finger MYM-type protein 1-like, partial [Aphis craccivora]
TFHISYTIPIANYSAEREFNKLARIKNKYRTNSSQENLNSFMVLCTESDVLEVINTQDIIRVCFPKIKKKIFIKITILFLY